MLHPCFLKHESRFINSTDLYPTQKLLGKNKSKQARTFLTPYQTRHAFLIASIFITSLLHSLSISIDNPVLSLDWRLCLWFYVHFSLHWKLISKRCKTRKIEVFTVSEQWLWHHDTIYTVVGFVLNCFFVIICLELAYVRSAVTISPVKEYLFIYLFI